MSVSKEVSDLLACVQEVAPSEFEAFNRGEMPERGGKLFADGLVGPCYLGEDGALCSRVGRSDAYFRFVDNGLDWGCSCRAGSTYGVCEHLSAFAIDILSQSVGPKASNISASGKLTGEEAVKVFLRRPSPWCNFSELTTAYGAPREILAGLGVDWSELDDDMSFVAHLSRPLSESLADFAKNAEACGVEFLVDFGEDGDLRMVRSLNIDTHRLHVGMKKTKVCLSKMPFDCDAAEGDWLCDGVYLASDGELFILERRWEFWLQNVEDAANRVSEVLFEKRFTCTSGDLNIPYQVFNGVMASSDWDLRDVDFYGVEGTTFDAGSISLEPVQINLAIKPPNPKSDDRTMSLNLELRMGNRKIYLNQIIEELWRDIRFLEKLIQGKGQKSACAAKRKLALEVLIGDDVEGSHIKGQCEWVDSFLEKWNRSRIALQCFPLSTRQSWYCVKIPLDKIAAIALCLWPWDGWDHEAAIHRSVSVFDKGLLIKLFWISAKVGSQVSVGKRRAQLETVCVSVRSIGGTDWLSSKIETRDTNIDLPVTDWKQLLDGILYLDGPSGKVIIPIVDRAESIREIRSLLDRSDTRRFRFYDDPLRDESPLQLMSWIALAAGGLQITPPVSVSKTIEVLNSTIELPEVSLPESLQATLYPYQMEGFCWVRFLRDHGLGACLADEMGLGKTVQTIAFLASEYERGRATKPSLVVVPLSLIGQWHQELERFCPMLSVRTLHGVGLASNDLEKINIFITTYETVVRRFDDFAEIDFAVLVLDEAQQCKNKSTKRWHSIAALKREFTLVITGTPMENHEREFVSVMDLALPGFACVIEAKVDFNQFHTRAFSLIAKCASPFLLRRKKAEVLNCIPQKRVNNVYLDMDGDQAEFYARMQSEVIESVEGDKDSIAILAGITRLRQICVSPSLTGVSASFHSPKIKYLVDELVEMRKKKRSCLVFSQFTAALDELEEELKGAGLSILRIDGAVSGLRRQEIVRDFQGSSTPQVMLLSLKAGGVGLNLTKASAVFLLDPWWNPAAEDQAVDRAHRIGQMKTVDVRRLVMRGTLEEQILSLQRRKRKIFECIVEGASSRVAESGKLTAEDFRTLLSLGPE